MDALQEGDDMERKDNICERFAALARQTEPGQQPPQTLEAPTRPAAVRLRWWRGLGLGRLAIGSALGLLVALVQPIQAKTFSCGAGDVACLINAINEANANGQTNTIRLAA